MHLAIIPDGNRRWAKSKALLPWEGHKTAIENFRKITDFCYEDPRIDMLTVWCFSTENWGRDKKEIDILMNLLEDYLQKEREMFAKKQTRFLHSGRKDRIPSSLANLIKDVENETKDFDSFTLHLAIDYGGKDESIRAFNRYIQSNEDNKDNEVNEATLRAYLDQPSLPDIDTIIRTSNEKRTSNFFLWQSAYSEWFFVDRLFPDFTSEDLAKVIDCFGERTRRFGS